MNAPFPTSRNGWRLRTTAYAVATVIAAFIGVEFYRAYAHSAERRQALTQAAASPGPEAISSLERCLDHNPTDAEVLRAIVEVMIRTNAPVTTTQAYVDRWVAANPDDPHAHRARMEAMILMSRFEEAIWSAQRVLELAPERADVRAALGSLYLKVGRWDEAAREHQRLVESGATTMALIGLARAEMERGRRPQAIAALDRALRDNPQSTDARMLRGLVEFQAGDYQSALNQFRLCRPSSPNEQELWLYHMCLCLDRLGQTEESKRVHAELRAMQTAIRHGDDARQRPQDVDLQVRAAESYIAAKQPELAYKIVQEALAHCERSRKLLLALASTCDAVGRADEARQARSDAEQAP